MHCSKAVRPATSLFVVAVVLALVNAPARGENGPGAMEKLCAGSGTTGGLVVLIGCRDAVSPVALATTGRYLVHVLESDPAVIESARKSIDAAGKSGLASVDELARDGKLPYTENLVNTIFVGEGGAAASGEEIARVLRPGGAVFVRSAIAGNIRLGLEPSAAGANSEWACFVKPWPAAMDQWTHARHGADGNAVSRDALVALPQRVRWVAGPQQEISNFVAAGGRAFFAGTLVRDAFNGLRLWETPLNPSPARGGFMQTINSAVQPIATDRLLLVWNDKVLQALEAGTGQKIREYPEAGIATDVLLVSSPRASTILSVEKDAIRALDLDTGKLLWKMRAPKCRAVAAGDGVVYYIEGDPPPEPPATRPATRPATTPSKTQPAATSASAAKAKPATRPAAPPAKPEPLCLIARDLATGQLKWQRKSLPWLGRLKRCTYHAGYLACELSTFKDEKTGNALQMVSSTDGEALWQHEFTPGAAHKKQARAMFVGGLVWVLEPKKCVGFDPRTGEQRKELNAPLTHCFPPVATERYLLTGEMDFVDFASGKKSANPITKQACSRDAGVVPANGLLYTFPKHCICWPMLRDYAALAGARAQAIDWEHLKFAPEPGPAKAPTDVAENSASDWPVYRHDALRSGTTASEIPSEPKILWTTTIGDRPDGPIAKDWRENYYVRSPVGPPVIAGGLVYVTRPDAHQVIALDLQSGSIKWTFTANGRVDTAPTLYRGLCLFGCKSGWVYCVRAADGALVWKLRAAPVDERIIAYGQLESPWPVPGSILVIDGMAYFSAGRQPLADGGVLTFAVEPETGTVRWMQRLDKVPQTNFYGSSGLEFDNFDLLQQEGDCIAMSRWLFDRSTGKLSLKAKSGFVQLANGSSSVIFPRGSWSYAPRNESEQCKERPFVRPLAIFRDNSLFGCSQDRKSVYRRDFKLEDGEKFSTDWFAGWATYKGAREGGDLWRSQRISRGAAWTVAPFETPANKQPVSAMILAGSRLCLASATGRLCVVDAKDGSVLSQLELPAPAWDGLAAAGGKVLMTTQDGKVVCLGGSRQ